MGLLGQIQADVKTALKAGDAATVGALRLTLAALHNREIEKRGAPLTDEEAGKVLQSEAKKRKEAIELFVKGSRADLAERERAELRVIEQYLPKLMTDEETRAIVERILAALPAGTNFGGAMKAAAAELKGRADNALVAKLIREKLGL